MAEVHGLGHDLGLGLVDHLVQIVILDLGLGNLPAQSCRRFFPSTSPGPMGSKDVVIPSNPNRNAMITIVSHVQSF